MFWKFVMEYHLVVLSLLKSLFLAFGCDIVCFYQNFKPFLNMAVEELVTVWKSLFLASGCGDVWF